MGDRFYDFYTLLNIPPPTSASWLFSTTSSLPFDADAVKKCYRKASLKHHPDKGGNPATFIRLKRAQKVLSDDGLRARYDLLGLDSGRDDGSTDPPPDAAEGEAEESDRSGGSSLKQLHAAVSGHLLSALVKCVGLYFILLVIQYKYLLLPASLGLWFVVGFRGGDVDKEARIIIACVPVAACVMLWSGAGGWVFWLGEGKRRANKHRLRSAHTPMDDSQVSGVNKGHVNKGQRCLSRVAASDTAGDAPASNLCEHVYGRYTCMAAFPPRSHMHGSRYCHWPRDTLQLPPRVPES